jgi:SAM-dependent methyltransferase
LAHLLGSDVGFVPTTWTPYDWWQGFINKYAFASKFVKDKAVLDIGCGPGCGSSLLLRKGASEVIGIDLSKAATNYAQRFYKKQRLEFMRLDATRLVFPDESFDVVTCFDVIEHIRNYRLLLGECKRVLKSGGLFICSTPNKQVTPNVIKTFGHVHEFLRDEFYALLLDYFAEVSMYGHEWLDTNLSIWKSMQILFGIGARVFYLLPEESVGAHALGLKNFLKGLASTHYLRLSEGEEIRDEMLDENYEPFPLSGATSKMPRILIAACSGTRR